ncbi:MAG: hypothetical protein AB7G37_01115 [Solirubrobacteraceae bacterium]
MTDDREELARRQFDQSTANHEMRVLHEDGVYRHVRFAQPGRHSWSYLYDLVTWPGHLSISGDLESYTFRRTTDMFTFFNEPTLDRINPHYWGEKLVAPRGRDAVRVYVPELVEARLNEWVADQAEHYDCEGEELASLRDAVRDLVRWNSDIEWSEDAARSAIRDFEHRGRSIYDPSEWSFRDWDHHFLTACWAIKRGVERYWAHIGGSQGADRG